VYSLKLIAKLKVVQQGW